MYGKLKDHLSAELTAIKDGGIFKRERIITSPQGARVHVSSGDEVVIMCANNYLGLSSHPSVIQAAKDFEVQIGGAFTAAVRFAILRYLTI